MILENCSFGGKCQDVSIYNSVYNKGNYCHLQTMNIFFIFICLLFPLLQKPNFCNSHRLPLIPSSDILFRRWESQRHTILYPDLYDDDQPYLLDDDLVAEHNDVLNEYNLELDIYTDYERNWIHWYRCLDRN